MKILILGNANSPHLRRWAEAFKKDHQVLLASDRQVTIPYGNAVQFISLASAREIPKIRFLTMALRLRRLIRDFRPDILHAQGAASAGWLGALSGFHPFLLTAHGSDLMLYDQRSLFHKISTRVSLKTADYLTCVSDVLTQKARQMGVPASRVRTIYLGVDTRIFKPQDKQAVRTSLKLGSGPLIYHLRSLRPIYNSLIFAQAIPGILAAFPDARFIVPEFNADNNTQIAFKKILQDNNTEHAIIWLPPLDRDEEIASWLAASDIAVSLAASDGTPKSVQEAMSCAVPPIAGDIPSLRAVIKSGTNGMLIPLDAPAALTHAVIRLLKEPAVRESLGKEARTNIIDNASAQKTMRQYDEIYTRLAHRPASDATTGSG